MTLTGLRCAITEFKVTETACVTLKLYRKYNIQYRSFKEHQRHLHHTSLIALEMITAYV